MTTGRLGEGTSGLTRQMMGSRAGVLIQSASFAVFSGVETASASFTEIPVGIASVASVSRIPGGRFFPGGFFDGETVFAGATTRFWGLGIGSVSLLSLDLGVFLFVRPFEGDSMLSASSSLSGTCSCTGALVFLRGGVSSALNSVFLVEVLRVVLASDPWAFFVVLDGGTCTQRMSWRRDARDVIETDGDGLMGFEIADCATARLSTFSTGPFSFAATTRAGGALVGAVVLVIGPLALGFIRFVRPERSGRVTALFERVRRFG